MANAAEAGASGNPEEVERGYREASPHEIAQILDGELHVQPRPARPHTKVASELGFDLGPPFVRGRGGPGGWVILHEPEIWLGPRPDKIVPDLAGWRRERMLDPASEDVPYYDVAPDWVCEVLSPGTERIDRGKKMRIYAREGVPHIWLVNPVVRTVEVYRLEGGHWLLLGTFEGDAVMAAEPFDAVEIRLGDLWAG